MMVPQYVKCSLAALFAVALMLDMAGHVQGQVLFSSLKKTLLVTATLPNGAPLTEVHSRTGQILVTWKLNSTLGAGVDAAYRKIQTKLCFGKISQTLRKWRATNNDLSKDKTCIYAISTVPYTAAGGNTTYTVSSSIPGASYLVRAYAINATGQQVAYGQTTDANRTLNTFVVIPITGRHASIDIAVGVFSAFSVLSLFSFFLVENYLLKRKKVV